MIRGPMPEWDHTRWKRTRYSVPALYNIPNVAYDGVCVFTNRPVCSSMRGFAVINGTAAVELQMDKLAEAISMDPMGVPNDERLAKRRSERDPG